jgi:catechol 2,3-dioxygenase-like lactoylglutathione lyase family enzyme
MRLDHVALATRDATPALAVLVGELGATVLSGGLAIGYRPMQVFLGDEDAGMKIELLEPWEVEQNDFLDRFVTRHGEGPHHLTFKVDDIEVALERVEAAGITPVGVDLSMPIWREAFIQPRDAHGTVVQIASSTSPFKSPLEEFVHVRDHGVEAGEMWWKAPAARAPETTFLRRIVMGTPNMPDALSFFSGLLEGEPVVEREGAVELAWPGGGRLRLEPSTTAGIDRLELERAGSARVLEVAGARLSIAPEPPPGQ